MSVLWAGLAQLVEHVICNHGVAGSNPAAGTNKFKDLQDYPHLTYALIGARVHAGRTVWKSLATFRQSNPLPAADVHRAFGSKSGSALPPIVLGDSYVTSYAASSKIRLLTNASLR